MSFNKGVKWCNDTLKDINIEGKVILVTGANSGIGREFVRVVGNRGAKVLMACRNEKKCNEAIEELVNGISEYGEKYPHPLKVPKENLSFIKLDLSDLNSIEECAKSLIEKETKIDILVLNAGVMAPNKKESTVQGFEMQLGVNVFGHYALTCRLIPLVQKSANPRIVFVSSVAHKTVNTIHFEDIDHNKGYSKWIQYGESKLGNLLLMHKFSKLYPTITVVGCHPGYSNTNLQDGTSFAGLNSLFAQPAFMGGLPTVLAALDPNLISNTYIGPYWVGYGLPTKSGMSSSTKNEKLIEKLYTVCGEKTGLSPP